jgi:hypothetical protein
MRPIPAPCLQALTALHKTEGDNEKEVRGVLEYKTRDVVLSELRGFERLLVSKPEREGERRGTNKWGRRLR